ncbi:hypothetical protein BGZ72_008723 [Mortierella alpina]|nr:hypothetical protein BGZ72_008723 [Mortierella alpina]
MSHSKVPLNVVFIIDTHLPHDADEFQRKRAVALLNCSLVRILLYFQCNMDSKFQWTHQFFNSRMHQDIGLVPNRVLQGLSMSTITSCVEEYRKLVTAETISAPDLGKMPSQVGSGLKPPTHAAVSPCFNLRRQLVHSLADFGLDISSYQSPMKPASSLARSHSLQKHFPPVAIRNYMYVFTPLPRTWTEIVSFLDGKRPSQIDSFAMGPRRNDILEVLKGVKDAFFDQGLWDRFLDQRMSLNWIDTSARSNTEEPVKVEQIMKAFGGYIIPQKIFCRNMVAKDVYSFATVFQTYRSLQINPGLGVKMSKESWQALPSTPNGMQCETQPIEVVWSGDVLSAQSSKFNLNLESIRATTTVMCFPQDDGQEPCQHASYLLESLRSKGDVLLLDITFLGDGSQAQESPEATNDPVNPDPPKHYTRQALLHPTTQGKGIIQILEDGLDLRHIHIAIPVTHTRARPFSTAMMEKSWGGLGAFIDEVDIARLECFYRLDTMPAGLLDCFRLPACASDASADAKSASSKPLPGDTLDEILPTAYAMAETIDDLCLGIRKAYIEHLYKDEHTVIDYVKRLNAATKDITALAAKQSLPLKEAQLGKEVNSGKATESKTQDHYVILQDERPELDAWKAEIMKSVKDMDVRMQLRKLKTKDTQIQIVQNLHILLLIDKYGLEENKPFKKDPGALKATNLFMDELCISASLEDRPAPGLMSPQTPRSKDMDSAKKFFTRVIARFYAPSLPKIVEKLAIKCGAEKTFLTSPRSKRSMMKRSMSMGVLQKPRPLDLSALSQLSVAEASPTTGSSTPKDNVAPKHGFPMSRNSTSDNPSRNVLNSSLFRNRQVTMTRGSFKGLDARSSSSTSQARQSRPTLAQSHSHSTIQRSQSTVAFDGELEDEDAPPQLAKLKLKKFYHDKESEEVLKIFRRKGPLSKADAIGAQGSERNTGSGDDEKDGNDGLDSLESSLARGGTTSWGVINSFNATSSAFSPEGLKSPSSSAAWRRSSPRKQTRDRSPSKRLWEASNTSPSLPADSFVPSTPSRKQGYFPEGVERTIEQTPTTPSGRAHFRRYHSQQIFSRQDAQSDARDITSQVFVPSTPTRKDQIHQGRTFASQIRGSYFSGTMDNEVLGSPGKRRRTGGIESDEDDEGNGHDAILEGADRPSQRYMQSPRRRSLQRAQTTSVLPSRSPTVNRQGGLSAAEMHAIRPDRKRVHMDGMFGSVEGVPKAVFVPGTPSSKLLDARTVTSYHSSASFTRSVENFDMENADRTTTPSSSTLLVSTPKSIARSPAIAASHFESFISSPTLGRDAPRRRIDFSLFATDD